MLHCNNQKYKRLFTFGCSFTKWLWPTWADIIAHDIELHYQNWGAGGAGNVAIANRMLECDMLNNFTEDDLILVCWSTLCREDRYFDNEGWYLGGNIHHQAGDPWSKYPPEFAQKYWSLDNDLIKTMSSIIMANKGFPIKYEAMVTNFDELFIDYDKEKSLPYKFYKSYFPTDSFPWNPKEQKPFDDHLDYGENHPDILAHLNFVENFVYPNLNLQIKQQTKEHYINLQQKVLDHLKTTEIKDLEHAGQIMNKLCDFRNKSYGYYSDL